MDFCHVYGCINEGLPHRENPARAIRIKCRQHWPAGTPYGTPPVDNNWAAPIDILDTLNPNRDQALQTAGKERRAKMKPRDPSRPDPRAKLVVIIDTINGNKETQYPSSIAAGLAIDATKHTVRAAVKGGHLIKHRWRAKYLKPVDTPYRPSVTCPA